jgi:uncharacterized protein (TIGR00251 family)
MPAWLREVPGGVELDLLVQPRASRTQVLGEHGGRLKVALAAPPVDGEANQALVELLASALGARKADVAVLRGESGRRKTVRVAGATPAAVLALLPRAGGGRAS